jgi:hypothetical protein
MRELEQGGARASQTSDAGNGTGAPAVSISSAGASGLNNQR